MKRKIVRIGFVVLFVLGGFASFMGRDFPSLRSRIGATYPATSLTFYLTVSGGGIFQSGDCNNAPVWAKVVGWTVVAPLSLLALPASAVIDTILLPIDIKRGHNGSSEQRQAD